MRESAKTLVLDLLKACNTDVTKETVTEKSFQTLVGAFVYDLASPTQWLEKLLKMFDSVI